MQEAMTLSYKTNALPTAEVGVILESTDNYSLRTAYDSDNPEVIVYAIFNDKTGIRELEFTSLPAAILNLTHIEDSLAQARAGSMGLQLPSTGSVQ